MDQLKVELTSSDHSTALPVRPPKAKLELQVSNNAKTFQTLSYLAKYVFSPIKEVQEVVTVYEELFLKETIFLSILKCYTMIHLNQDK